MLSFTLGAAMFAASSVQERRINVSEERIIRRTLTPRREKTDAEWAAFDALTDAEIAAAVADDPDAAPLDLDWTKDIRVVEPPAKQAIAPR
jgi:hypothetical protein